MLMRMHPAEGARRPADFAERHGLRADARERSQAFAATRFSPSRTTPSGSRRRCFAVLPRKLGAMIKRSAETAAHPARIA
jgi:hypothetical protein